MRAIATGSGYELVEQRGELAVAIGRGENRRRISTGTADPGLARVIANEIWQKLHAPASERVRISGITIWLIAAKMEKT